MYSLSKQLRCKVFLFGYCARSYLFLTFKVDLECREEPSFRGSQPRELRGPSQTGSSQFWTIRQTRAGLPSGRLECREERSIQPSPLDTQGRPRASRGAFGPLLSRGLLSFMFGRPVEMRGQHAPLDTQGRPRASRGEVCTALSSGHSKCPIRNHINKYSTNEQKIRFPQFGEDINDLVEQWLGGSVFKHLIPTAIYIYIYIYIYI